MCSVRENWIFVEQRLPKLKSTDVIMDIEGRQTIINSPNHGIQDVKKHVPGSKWKFLCDDMKDLFLSKLWRWESKEKPMKKRDGGGRGGSSQRKHCLSPLPDKGRLMSSLLVLSSFPLLGLWNILERSKEMMFSNWDLTVSPLLRYESLPVGWERDQHEGLGGVEED